MHKKRIIKVSTILYFISAIILTEPSYFSFIGFIHKYVYSIPVFIIFPILVLITIKNKLINKMLIYILLFYSIIFFSTIINNGDLSTLIISFIKVISFSLLVNIGIHHRKEEFLGILGFIFFIYAAINLIFMIKFPEGTVIDYFWFLGHKNGLIKWLLPGAAFIGLSSLIKKDRLSLFSWIYIIIMIFSIVISGSSTSLISIAIFAIVLLLTIKNINTTKLINPKTSIITNMIFFVSIIIIKLQKYFEYFIVHILKKGLNFTGRDALWDRILVYIQKKPLFGYGITDLSTMQHQLQYTNTSSHNMILDFLYEGGIVCILILISIIILSYRKNKELIKNNEKQFSYLYGIFFSFSIVWMTDTFVNLNMINVFSLLILIYNMDLLCKRREVLNEKYCN